MRVNQQRLNRMLPFLKEMEDMLIKLRAEKRVGSNTYDLVLRHFEATVEYVQYTGPLH